MAGLTDIAHSSLKFRSIGRFSYEELSSFDCQTGSGDRHGAMLNEWVRTAVWMQWGESTRVFEFVHADGSVVGYLLVQQLPFKHPTHASRRTRDYVYLAAMGVQREFQGVHDPAASGETYAEVIMRTVETTIVKPHPRLAGAFLLTATDNERAIGLVRKAGYVEDEAGEFIDREDGEARLLFRKPLSAFRASD